MAFSPHEPLANNIRAWMMDPEENAFNLGELIQTWTKNPQYQSVNFQEKYAKNYEFLAKIQVKLPFNWRKLQATLIFSIPRENSYIQDLSDTVLQAVVERERTELAEKLTSPFPTRTKTVARL